MATSNKNKNKKNTNISGSIDRSSSYNVKIDGVLEKNIETRNKLITLKDKYARYEDVMSPAIGEYYQVRTLDVKSSTDNKGLTSFTYDNASEYGKTILSRYFKHMSANDDVDQYSIDDSDNSMLLRWNGNYDDYRRLVENSKK